MTMGVISYKVKFLRAICRGMRKLYDKGEKQTAAFKKAAEYKARTWSVQ